MFQKKQKKMGRSPIVIQEDKSNNFSYYSSRTIKNNLKRSKPKTNDDITQSNIPANNIIGRIPAFFILIFVVLILGYLLYLDNNVKIKNVSDNHSQFLKSTNIYKEASEKYLSNSIANNTKITINNLGLSDYMLSRFPEISNATPELGFLSHFVTLKITEAKPVGILYDQSKRFYLIKNNGVAMALVSNNNSENFVNLMPYIIESFSSIKINQRALSNSDLSFISYAYNELAIQSIKTTSYTLVPNSRELDIKVNKVPYMLKFNLEEPVKEQVGSYLALKGYLQANNINPSQYIDVRVIGRAYYK
jgi:hypothetical protein